MLPPLLTALALVAATQADADLARRLEMAGAAGARFALAPPAPGAASAVAPPACTQPAAGLCDINWASAPQGFVPLALPPPWEAELSLGQAEVLLRTEAQRPLIVISRSRGEVLLALDLDAGKISQPGAALRRWPYFNYLLHVAACAASEAPPPRFSEWPHAPLPGPQTRLGFVAGLGVMWLLALALYQLARRRGRRAPDAATRFLAAVAAARQGDEPEGPHPDKKATGLEAFARPLSGLLTLLAAMVLLTGPYFALQSLISQRIQPFPEADGLWRYTADALFILWLTFDVGTQTAFVKYFAEHRVSHPEAALRDVQFYIWFQVFTRLVEMSLLLAFALGYLPGSPYAIYTPVVLVYTAICQPAFPAVAKFLCQAIQRFDYYNLLDFLEQRLLCFLVPMPLILLGRAWGRLHPEFGEAYGAAMGLGVGQLANSLVMLAIGLYALHRLGLPVRPLFLAQFGPDTARRQLWFGLKLTLGQEPFRLTSFLESLILIRWLRDFPTWLGLRDLLHNRLTFLAYFAWGYYQSAVPAVSEAFSVGKLRLVQYYVLRYLQFGFLFSTTIFSLLCSIGPLYIRVALGEQWGRAADYLLIAAASGLFLPWAWLTDSLQQGAGRPGTTTIIMLLEQGARLILLMLLVPRFQFLGIYLALLSALLLKVTVAWTLNHRRIVPLTLPLWSAVGAPGLAALINYALWRGAAGLLAPTSTAAVLGLFFVAGAGSIGLCFFFYGLVGGLDAAARRELLQAGRLSAVLGPLCRALAAAAEAGARLSPIQPQPPTVWQAAQKESAELERPIL